MPRAIPSSRRLRRGATQRGAAAVEFALVFPVLVALILGGIDGGVAIQARTSVANATREAARTVATGGDAAALQASVDGSMNYLPGTYSYSYTCKKNDGAPCGAAMGTDDASGGEISITITYNFRSVTGFYPVFNFTMTQSTKMRIE